tara:strand:+ start:298 stop:591 length:294 start_codon:yes stop_codon:yes gene_type:complete
VQLLQRLVALLDHVELALQHLRALRGGDHVCAALVELALLLPLGLDLLGDHLARLGGIGLLPLELLDRLLRGLDLMHVRLERLALLLQLRQSALALL